MRETNRPRLATNPPRLASWLLTRLVPPDAYDAAAGDLDEEFRDEIVPRLGARRARRWYWRQSLSLAAAFAAARIRSHDLHFSFSRNDNMRQDLRDALRTVVRNPSYSVITIAVLALGIGATSAIFSFVDGVLLRPLPYENADRIVRLWEQPPGSPGGRNAASSANFLDWQQQNGVFDIMAAAAGSNVTMSGSGEPQRILGTRVSAGYFDIFGTKAALGRTFAPGEDQPGAPRVAIMTHKLWASTFESDPTIIGRAIVFDREPHTIVGVLPAGSAFDRGTADLFRPFVFGANERSRNFHWLQVSARLRPGVTVDQARAAMQPIAARIARDYPASNKDWGITIERLADVTVAAPLRQSLRVLMAAVGMLLLVACANVANLALARGTVREREVLVRAAIGASRARIVRQFLTESLLLSCAGGALGLGVGYAMMRGLQLLLPPFFLPREALVTIDLRAALFAFVVSMLTGLIFGMFPALQAGRLDLTGSMKGIARTVTADRFKRRLRDALVVTEVALACTLLVGSGLLMRSFMRMQEVEVGRDPATLLTAGLATLTTRFSTPDEGRAFYRRILDRTAAIPGVVEVALASSIPMRGWGYGMPFRIGDRPAGDASSGGGAGFKMVSPSYFETIGLPILRGRSLQATDMSSSVRVLVVNKRFAERYFPGADPIGQHLLIEEIRPDSPQLGPEVPWEIVGIVANERVFALNAEDSFGVYAALEQSPTYGPLIVIRTSSEASVTASALKAAIHEIDPNQPVTNVRTLASIKAESVAPDRMRTWLIVFFGGIAALLAGIGVYGVISYSVAQRTHEIGLRAALGASRARLMAGVMTRALLLTALGLIGGVGGAIASTRWLETLLFGIAPRDTISLVGACAILGLIALSAAWIPARRAARVDPLVALRVE